MAKTGDFDWIIEPWLVQPGGFRGTHSDEAEQARQAAIEEIENMIRAGMMMAMQMRSDPAAAEHVEAFAAHRALFEISRECAGREIASFRMLAGLPPESNKIWVDGVGYEWRAADDPQED